MNKSITVAAVSVSIMIFSRILMGTLALLSGQVSLLSIVLPVALAILILIGIIKGHRLAWQWGRMLGLLGAFVLTCTAIGTAMCIPEGPGFIVVTVLLAMQGVPLFPMFFALGTTEAKEHFRVICPGCGEIKVRGGNFLFTKAVCRNCNMEWS